MIILGIGLSMDSLALSVSCGLRNSQNKLITALKVSIIFALIQASTPLIGFFTGKLLSRFIQTWDHWIAFILLGLIGGNMIREGFSSKTENECSAKESKLTLVILCGMGIATSIDALAAGVTLAFLPVNIVLAVLFIGLATLLISFIGYYLGDIIGELFQKGAEIFGGVVLFGLGTKILVEHLFFGG